MNPAVKVAYAILVIAAAILVWQLWGPLGLVILALLILLVT